MPLRKKEIWDSIESGSGMVGWEIWSEKGRASEKKMENEK